MSHLGSYVVIGVIALAYLAGAATVLVVDVISAKPPRDVEAGDRSAES